MAVAGVTIAAAVSAGAGVAAGWPAGQPSSAAFARFETRLDASQQPAAAARPANYLRLEQLSTKAAVAQVAKQVAAARLAGQARRAAARAAARRAAARAAARRAAAQQPVQSAAQSTQVAAGSQASGSPQQIAAGMLASFGWPSSEFSCLDSLWSQESGWSVTASNPSSGAYGIPQALPGSKMAGAGADWQTNAATQIRWGLGYIRSTYGSPCAAWSHEQSAGWY